MGDRLPASVIEIDSDDDMARPVPFSLVDPGRDRDFPFLIIDDNDDDAVPDAELIVLDDSDDDNDDESDGDMEELTRSATPPLPAEIELEVVELNSERIWPGDVVELHGSQPSKAALPHGDFLAVKSIHEVLTTGETRLRGYRLRRTAHVAPMFDKGINEVFLYRYAVKGDPRAPEVQGLEEVDLKEIFRKRVCVFTHSTKAVVSGMSINRYPQQVSSAPSDPRLEIFNHGKLICRYVNTDYRERHGTATYKAEVRFMYKREAEELNSYAVVQNTTAIPTTEPESASCTVQGRQSPQKIPQKSFGDYFCGIGGASLGAKLAGLRIKVAVDNDEETMTAYKKNFPHAQDLVMDAAEIPHIAGRGTHATDHIHFSTCCHFWAMSHTIEGKNDDQNIATLFTVGPILRKLKPATFTAEQVPGLLIKKVHRPYFRILINSILDAGYNVRYELQDMAWHGLPGQHRIRLIFVGARVGHPIPPIPQPEYGPNRSGLKRYRTIYDALDPLRRQGLRPWNMYHQPAHEQLLNKEPYDPKNCLTATITCSGGGVHFSGKRRFTVVEAALLQGFGIDHQFQGTKTKARMQVGNAWGPPASTKFILQCAATQEAFDLKLIGAEDDIHDLYRHLESKGITIPGQASTPIDLFEDTVPPVPPYRYITQLRRSVQPRAPLIVFARRKNLTPAPDPRDEARANRPFRVFDGAFDG